MREQRKIVMKGEGSVNNRLSISITMLDYGASGVVEAMLPVLSERFGNRRASRIRPRGRRGPLEDRARSRSPTSGVGKEESFFTSGGTESDNMAVKGRGDGPGPGHIITSRIEDQRGHARGGRGGHWRPQGLRGGHLPRRDGNGRWTRTDAAGEIRTATILISLMHANSEIWHHPARAQSGDRPRARPSRFHMDACADIGKVPIRSRRVQHRHAVVLGPKNIRAPKGRAGSVYIRKGTRWSRSRTGGEQRAAGAGQGPRKWPARGLGRRSESGAAAWVEEGQRLTGLRDGYWRV